MSENKKLTVIMAAYNEIASISEVVSKVLGVDIPGIEIDLIIVESASSDGTREVVSNFVNHPRVTVVLQNEPRGKGNAVREGLTRATGDFILIQDADLEYDVADYPLLLNPLLSNATKFVLGTRHQTGRAMRTFGKRGLRSGILNVAHKVFTQMFNIVYGTRLTDPFTMYKVFSHDAISGIQFESNRFDFDWELVAKLVRRGFSPIEVPISYNSRGFEEGKKVRFFRDPITWMVALIKYRVQKI